MLNQMISNGQNGQEVVKDHVLSVLEASLRAGAVHQGSL